MRPWIPWSFLATVPFWGLAVQADSSATIAAEVPGPPSESPRWLDEVRAQREAWEAHRQARKEASDARLRLLDPVGAAQLEEREKENERFREASRRRAQQKRQSMAQERQAHRRELQRWLDQRDNAPYPYTPYDWDNRWFYRGY